MSGVDLEAYEVTRPYGEFGQRVEEFNALLDSAASEQDLQSYLERFPIILAEQLPHCHYVVPKPRLGSEYVPDFLLPEMSSAGTDWYLVELEPARAKLVTQSGLLADRLRGAIQQIRDWRDWLSRNLDYAARPTNEHGLGLENISARNIAWIIVGRRSDVTDRFNQLRDQVWKSDLIQIKTYDRIVEWARKRAAHWDAWDSRNPFRSTMRETDPA